MPLSASVLELRELFRLGRVVHDLDDVPAEGRLDRLEDLAVGQPGDQDGGLERFVDRALAVEERQLAAAAGRALRLTLVALLAGDRVEQVRVVLQPRPGRDGGLVCAASHDGSSAGTVDAPVGSSFGE